MADFGRMAQKAKDFREREESILNTAEQLFIKHGEDKVTVEMIADEVGIGKGTVYKHFESKDEIYLLLMIRYEEELARRFEQLQVSDEKARLAREYFAFRIQNPNRYLLFHRLERKMSARSSCPELLARLHKIRASNFDKLNAIVQARINDGVLEDVPAHYHVLAAWAVVHGAIALTLSPFYQEMLEDQDDFIRFFSDAAMRFGTRKTRAEDAGKA